MLTISILLICGISLVFAKSEQSKLVKVPLISRQPHQVGGMYMGTIFLGYPYSQPVRVVFDTGSENLVVTSEMCFDQYIPQDSLQDLNKHFNLTLAQGTRKQQRCHTLGYDSRESSKSSLGSSSLTQQQLHPKTLQYGTAKFEGLKVEDNLCLRPLSDLLENSSNPQSKCLAHELEQKKCTNLTFYAAYEFEGIEKYIDGILGLAPSS